MGRQEKKGYQETTKPGDDQKTGKWVLEAQKSEWGGKKKGDGISFCEGVTVGVVSSKKIAREESVVGGVGWGKKPMKLEKTRTWGAGA